MHISIFCSFAISINYLVYELVLYGVFTHRLLQWWAIVVTLNTINRISLMNSSPSLNWYRNTLTPIICSANYIHIIWLGVFSAFPFFVVSVAFVAAHIWYRLSFFHFISLSLFVSYLHLFFASHMCLVNTVYIFDSSQSIVLVTRSDIASKGIVPAWIHFKKRIVFFTHSFSFNFNFENGMCKI